MSGGTRHYCDIREGNVGGLRDVIIESGQELHERKRGPTAWRQARVTCGSWLAGSLEGRELGGDEELWCLGGPGSTRR